MVLKILKIVGFAILGIFLLLFGVAFSKVDKNSKTKLKDAFAGLFGKKSVTNQLLLGNKFLPSGNAPVTLTKKTTSIAPSTPISNDEKIFIDINGFEVASIIILRVNDPISVSGAKDMEVYTRKLNTPLKANQVGWTRNGEEVFKRFNPDGSFYYTIVPYIETEEPPMKD